MNRAITRHLGIFLLLTFQFSTCYLKSQNVFTLETNTTAWQTLNTNSTWTSATAASPSSGFLSFVQSKGFASATTANLIWGSTISSGVKLGYTSSLQDSFNSKSATFAKLRSQFTLPDSICKMDSARIWLICDDGVDSVWINNNLVLTTPILYYGINYVTATIPTNLLNATANEVQVRTVNFILNYALYAKLNVYYKKEGSCCTAITKADSLVVVTSDSTNWQAQDSLGALSAVYIASPSPGFLPFVQSKGFATATANNVIWGKTYTKGTKTGYSDGSNTSTFDLGAQFVKFRKTIVLSDSICKIDSARIWLICDDGIDSVWINNKLILTTPILFYGLNYVTAQIPAQFLNPGNNSLVVRAVDYYAFNGFFAETKFYTKKGNCCVPTAIIEPNQMLNDITTVYPNPVINTLYLQTSLQHFTAQILDLSGRIISTSTDAKALDVSILPSGIYLLRLQQAQGNVVKRFVKE